MICGDPPYKKVFPYRNIQKLSVFFQELGLDYKYDRSDLRIIWVKSVISDLNEKANPTSDTLSHELNNVIRKILDPNDYSNLRFTDLGKARKLMEKLLEEYHLSLKAIIAPENEMNKSLTKASEKKTEEFSLKITPNVFTIPHKKIDKTLVSIMMPFSKEYDEVYDAIKSSCEDAKMKCQRADDIWENSEIIQDIFELILTSSIVIADFSSRNPNVFYEIGIAHTLGKPVIPIAQNKDDVPFDLSHHRVLVYLNNCEGREKLREVLTSRIMTIQNEILSA